MEMGPSRESVGEGAVRVGKQPPSMLGGAFPIINNDLLLDI
jgi:hypothetical protein